MSIQIRGYGKRGLQINTIDTIHTILHPTFQLAVRDGIIRTNPSDRVMAELRKKTGNKKGIRHALAMEQQRVFERCDFSRGRASWMGTGYAF